LFEKFRTHFISGILVLAPFFLTVIFIGYLVKIVDAFVVNPLFRLLPVSVMDATVLVYLTKIAIGLFVILFISLVGILAERLIFRQILVFLESLLRGIPVFSKVYGSIKEIKEAFFRDKGGVFRRVVYLEYPRKGIYALGFVTQEKDWEITTIARQRTFTVFIPSPPNPATGFFIFVPESEIIPSALTVEEGIKLVISGGAAVPSVKAPSSPALGA